VIELEERLGEFLMVGFEGREMDGALAAHIRELRPAGLIFFRRNIVAPEQLARLTREIQGLAEAELGRPLFLAVDQEGGTVARLPAPFSRLPEALSLGEEGPEAVELQSGLTAREMRLVGLNLNFAPVLDVNGLGPSGPMYRRSFGSDPTLVARCGAAAVAATQGEGIMATAKHFPGLGRAPLDPHHELPVVAASREELHYEDLLPFRTVIQAGVACVMTSHALYPSLDPEFPGTFSLPILHDLLRDQLGFGGLTITDDLEMGAVAARYTLEKAAVAALQGGADLLLVCNDPGKMREAAAAVRNGAGRGLLETERLSRSLARLAALRVTYLTPFNLPDPVAAAAYFSS
jgi:beta-N-acetylhexosaminidase